MSKFRIKIVKPLSSVLLIFMVTISCTATNLDITSFDNRINAFVQSEMQRGNIPGLSVAVIRRGKILKVTSYGFANLELNVAVNKHSVFELASLTKQFTAMAILMLAEENKLALDDHITRFIKDVPDGWKAITIKQLLSHSAGLKHRFEQTFNGVFMTDYSTDEMLRSAKSTAMNATPGTDWEYSDQGYFLLGLIIERITGQSYATFLDKRLFEPLGMKETYLLEQASIIPNRVAGYTVSEEKIKNIRRTWQFGLSSHFGVMSSISDMIKWEKSLYGRKVVSDLVLSKLWSPAYIFRENTDTMSILAYGFGWWIKQQNGRRFVEHSGYTGTAYFRDLETQLGIIVLTNRDQPSGQGTIDIAHGIAKIVDPTISFNTETNE
ncbi:MAG: beta-lactamase family protein [Alcanivoracaceae bacterium]|nr:beta-lactamase family protein [Alcanivoracaceae bacterium]